LPYYKFHYGQEQFVTDQDKPVCWYNRVFQLMPLPCARIMGFLFYKHLG